MLIRNLHSRDTRYAATGCDIVELRAIMRQCPKEFGNDPDGKKQAWRTALRDKLKGLTVREESQQLTSNERRHSSYGGAVGPFDATLPLLQVKAVSSSAFKPTEKAEVGAANVAAIKTKISGSLAVHHHGAAGADEAKSGESRKPITTGASEDFEARKGAIETIFQRQDSAAKSSSSNPMHPSDP